MTKKKVQLDLKDCLSCSICVQACPVSALTLTLEGKSGKYSNLFPELSEEDCIGCGICAGACPMSCITLVEADAN